MYTVGTWLIVIGLIIGAWQFHDIHGKEIAVGKVKGFVPYSSGTRGGVTYSMTATFPDHTGATHTYQANFGVQDPGYKEGDAVRIYFDRNNPADCGVLSFGYRFGVAWICLVLGLTLLLLAGGWAYGNKLMETLPATTVTAPHE